MHGGTMGVVYGAVSLWQWIVTADETGWDKWTDAPFSWHDALSFEGARYVGAISRAFDGFDFKEMERRWELTEDTIGLLCNEGKFYVSYMPEGGTIGIKSIPEKFPYYWFDPMKGVMHSEKNTGIDKTFTSPDTRQPSVFIAGRKTTLSKTKTSTLTSKKER